MSQKGELIAIEGGEGVGKTTNFTKLMRKAGDSPRIEFFREPGGTKAGERIRDVIKSPDFDLDPVTQFLLFMASRVNLFEKVIRPYLESGVHVVLDRFDPSTYVYQIFEPGRQDLEPFFRFLKQQYLRPLVESDWIRPFTILLDLDPEVAIARIHAQRRALDVNDLKPVEFHERLRGGYKFYLERLPHVTIDASAHPDVVYHQIASMIYEKTGVDLREESAEAVA